MTTENDTGSTPGAVAAAFRGQAALEDAEDLRWSEWRLVAAMNEPQDWCDLLDAAIRVLGWPDVVEYRDALAVRINEIVPEGLS